jgi:hypothetical protein
VSTVVYHVSSTLNRDSIAAHGLDWRLMRDAKGLAGSDRRERPCVFLARNLDEAEWFVTLSRNNHPSVDIWEITLLHDLDLEGELPAGLPYGEMDGFLYTTEPIPRESVRLLPASPQTGVAELLDAAFILRIGDPSGRVDADFLLVFQGPDGNEERWTFGWTHQDLRLDGLERRPMRERFHPLMRSMFEDHLYDLRERGLTPDRGYDQLSVRMEIPEDVARRLEAH